MRTAAGVISGLVGLVTFLIIHAVWITPIWQVAFVGIIIASLAGLVTAQCYNIVKPAKHARPLSWIFVFGATALPLLPGAVLPHLFPPLLESENGQVIHPINLPWLISGFFITLLIPAAITGGALGWFITKRRRPAALFSAMGLIMAVGPGHNLPLFGSEASGEQLIKALTLTFVPVALAAFALAECPTMRLMLKSTAPES